MKTYKIRTGAARDFKENYNTAKTCGDLDTVIKATLTPDDINALEIALDIVNTFTGLDMRQEFLLGELRGRTKYGQISKARMLLDYESPRRTSDGILFPQSVIDEYEAELDAADEADAIASKACLGRYRAKVTFDDSTPPRDEIVTLKATTYGDARAEIERMLEDDPRVAGVKLV